MINFYNSQYISLLIWRGCSFCFILFSELELRFPKELTLRKCRLLISYCAVHALLGTRNDVDVLHIKFRFLPSASTFLFLLGEALLSFYRVALSGLAFVVEDNVFNSFAQLWETSCNGKLGVISYHIVRWAVEDAAVSGLEHCDVIV